LVGGHHKALDYFYLPAHECETGQLFPNKESVRKIIAWNLQLN